MAPACRSLWEARSSLEVAVGTIAFAVAEPAISPTDPERGNTPFFQACWTMSTARASAHPGPGPDTKTSIAELDGDVNRRQPVGRGSEMCPRLGYPAPGARTQLPGSRPHHPGRPPGPAVRPSGPAESQPKAPSRAPLWGDSSERKGFATRDVIGELDHQRCIRHTPPECEPPRADSCFLSYSACRDCPASWSRTVWVGRHRDMCEPGPPSCPLVGRPARPNSRSDGESRRSCGWRATDVDPLPPLSLRRG